MTFVMQLFLALALVRSSLSVPPPLTSANLPAQYARPNGLVNQVAADAERLRFHRCFDEGEAYSASFLITKDHFLHFLSKPIDLSSTHMSMESASFMFMETRKATKQTAEKGAILQTLDMLDLSVVHLSAYERSLRAHDMSTKKGPAVDRLHRLANSLQQPILLGRGNSSAVGDQLLHRHAVSAAAMQPRIDSPFAQTLVLLPWAGSHLGVGNSQLSLRQVYLRICFWSFYRHYGNNIVIGVASQKDADIVQDELQLPAKHVLVFENVAVDRLPHALLREGQRRLGATATTTSTSTSSARDESWNKYKYVFFCESDQLLVLRDRSKRAKYGGKVGQARSDELYALLQDYPRSVLTPHRLIPYAHELLKEVYGINTAAHAHAGHQLSAGTSSAADQTSCCLPRQNCRGDRASWLPLRESIDNQFLQGNSDVPFLDIEGLMVAMGNANFRRGVFRVCKVYPQADVDGVCP